MKEVADMLLNFAEEREEEYFEFEEADFGELKEEEDTELPENHDEMSTISQEGDVDSDLLYPGAKVTLGSFMLLLGIFTSKYNLVGDAIQHLLSLFALLVIFCAIVYLHSSPISKISKILW